MTRIILGAALLICAALNLIRFYRMPKEDPGREKGLKISIAVTVLLLLSLILKCIRA